jgi:hypothetical protein
MPRRELPATIRKFMPRGWAPWRDASRSPSLIYQACPRGSPMARCEMVATTRSSWSRGEPDGAPRAARHDQSAPARGLSRMARPGRSPSWSVICELDRSVDHFGRVAPPRSGRALRRDRTETGCRNSRPGSPTLGRLTFRQLLAPILCGICWSMRSWESARPRQKRRPGVLRSHGPAEETLNEQTVNLRSTTNRRRCLPPRRRAGWRTVPASAGAPRFGVRA